MRLCSPADSIMGGGPDTASEWVGCHEWESYTHIGRPTGGLDEVLVVMLRRQG